MINEKELRDLIMQYARVEENFQLEEHMSLIKDLKYDSLRLVEFFAEVENKIGKEFVDLEEVTELVDSVGELIKYILRQECTND